jgi:P pilus assembly chaperone PapD
MLKRTFTAGLLLLASQAHAEGLVVAPTRIIFAPGQHSTEAALTNTTKEEVRYRIGVVDETLTASNTMQVSSTFPYSVKNMLRYTPKMVSLKPGQRQTIRLMVNRPDNLADGDYHSHLLLEQVPIKKDVSATTTPPRGNRLTLSVGVLYSMGIPVIVQQGHLTGAVALTGATLVRDAKGHATAVKAVLTHTGNAEGEGYLSASINGKSVAIPQIVHLYRETSQVEITMPLALEAQSAKPGAITLELRDDDGKTGKVLGTTVAQ